MPASVLPLRRQTPRVWLIGDSSVCVGREDGRWQLTGASEPAREWLERQRLVDVRFATRSEAVRIIAALHRADPLPQHEQVRAPRRISAGLYRSACGNYDIVRRLLSWSHDDPYVWLILARSDRARREGTIVPAAHTLRIAAQRCAKMSERLGDAP